MVDPQITKNQPNREEKLKNFMGKTPALLKSKFLSVLDSSNELLNDISNRLEFSLSLSTSSDNETLDDDTTTNKYEDDESWDENIIDFESRKVKERRAYEEVLSGKYRQPNLIAKMASEGYNIVDINTRSSSGSCSGDTNFSETSTPNIDEGNASTCNTHGSIVMSDKLDNFDDIVEEKVPTHKLTKPNDENVTSPSTSKCDPVRSSFESSDLNMWLHSESENSVPSWASSISLDSQTEEAIVEFMRKFVSALFEDSTTISLDSKSEFGLKSRTETGRMWFARLVSAQRGKSKRVNESTFYSLIQYFAIVLFECGDSEDYSPAKILMNMCFTFYHEIDVPGCAPYHEYLYHYLRAQPIWQSLRFWNAAFFDALQCQRVHRPVVPTSNRISKDQVSIKSASSESSNANDNETEDYHIDELKEDQQFQQNICFGQLGTFTCNMHAFGLSHELCMEFLRKQSVIANLSPEQEKMLRDNVNRMYKETAKWRA
ncbi:uncharacterized protein KIAA0513 [Bradysia coprophila]|uniref:uncharacterized protein KIAA0513 n=1 Tax=Bradysia coprophila TaxID=38358 RepID=UPI00187DAD7F|nr:uncharacterized protein KIAA0513 [Bradysia coprophila]